MDSAAETHMPPTSRSAVSNGSRLFVEQVDGRTRDARRMRDLVKSFSKEFGHPGEREMALIRQAAAVAVQAERMQAAIARGADIDPRQLLKLTNTLLRALREIGLRKRRAEPRQSLRDALLA